MTLNYFEINQEFSDVKEWMETNANVGMLVAIYDSSYNQDNFYLDEITRLVPVKPKSKALNGGRMGTGRHGDFYFNGKNCFHPKGQKRILIPTKKVMSAAISGNSIRPLSEKEKELAKRYLKEREQD
jgi:hypothetical protein